MPKNLIYINNAFNGYSNVSFQVLDEDDEELIDLLGDLAADVGENQSQPPRTTPTTTEPSTTSQTFSAPSQVTPRSSIRPTTPLSRSQRKASQMDEDDEETLEMSQVVALLSVRTLLRNGHLLFPRWCGMLTHAQLRREKQHFSTQQRRRTMTGEPWTAGQDDDGGVGQGVGGDLN